MAKITPHELEKMKEENIQADIIAKNKKVKEAEARKKEVGTFNLMEIEREDVGARAKRVNDSVWDHRKLMEEKLTLVNATLTEKIPFAKGSLYLFGATSGHGKSTLAANATYALCLEKKKVLVISNEETEQAVLARVASLNLGLDFNKWRNMKTSGAERVLIDNEINKLLPYVTVIDMSRKHAADTSEGIKKILDEAMLQDYVAVIIDYFQNIKRSSENAMAKPYDILLEVRDYLNGYILKAPFPVILLAQLHPISKSKGNTTFEDRLKGCKAIYEVASTAVEIMRVKGDDGPDETIFAIAKDRFGCEGDVVPCKFLNGRFVVKTIQDMTKTSEVPVAKSEGRDATKS